ncbi:MAG: PDZ domain-containing protein [Planctomycetota bacterium]
MMVRPFFLAALLAAPALYCQEQPSDADRKTEAPELPAELSLPDGWAEQMDWRSIGPANMGGRIIAFAVYEARPATWWAATASGGLLKTTNNGLTFEHQFDQEGVVSIGHVAVAQSDPNVLWVGTGEGQPRNSVSYGNGVYKSVDGGKTWAHMGLKGTFQTGRIAIHPDDPETVYVGTLGRLYGHSEERGLYKTTDGGESWQRVLYVDERTGVIDVDMHPSDPDTLMVATYERQRDGFDTNDPAKRWGPGGGIYKTTDGGDTWEKVTKGLPTSQLGRIGIDYYRKDPNVLMAIVECEKIAQQPEDAPYHGMAVAAADAGVRVTRTAPARRRGRGRSAPAEGEEKEQKKPKQTPAQAAGLKKDDIVLSVGGERVNSSDDFERACRQHKASDKVTIAIVRDRKDMELDLTFGTYPEGSRSPFTGTLGGQAADMVDLQGAQGHEYGGIYESTDGGSSWTRINTLNPRPMYYSQIRIDPSDANNVMVCGTSLYRSTDRGRTFDRGAGNGIHVDHHATWIDPNNGDHILQGCDGGMHVTYDACKNWDHLNHVAIGQFYHVGVSPERNYRVYGGLQDNGSWGGPSRTAGEGPQNHDWQRIGGGDGFRCLVDPDDGRVVYSQSQNGPPSWRNLQTGERGSLRGGGGRGSNGQRERLRFNWETPYVLSGHNSKIVYTAGSKVLKSLNRGKNMKVISPEITNGDRGSATALAESPVDADVVYVGTDDGALWVTHDGGDNWSNCFEVPSESESAEAEAAIGVGDAEQPVVRSYGPRAFAGSSDADDDSVLVAQPIAKLVPGPRWVSEIVASQHDGKRAYVTLDGHRSDDDAAYVFTTDDAGMTWRSLAAGLPEMAGSTRTIAEDPVNEDVLYLGTEFHALVSLDRGQTWARMNGDLPTVAVHAFAINVPSGEIVAGTHGRSLWITSVHELRQMTAATMAKPAHFYEPLSAIIYRSSPSVGGTNRRFVGENPRGGAPLMFHLQKTARDVKLEVLDGKGGVLRELEAPTAKGLHRVNWNLRGRVRIPDGASERARQYYMRRGGSRVQPGVYTLRLTVDGEEMTRTLKVEMDPENSDPSWIRNEEAAELAEFLEECERDEREQAEYRR